MLQVVNLSEGASRIVPIADWKIMSGQEPRVASYQAE